jgi:hypothetical protein
MKSVDGVLHCDLEVANKSKAYANPGPMYLSFLVIESTY